MRVAAKVAFVGLMAIGSALSACHSSKPCHCAQQEGCHCPLPPPPKETKPAPQTGEMPLAPKAHIAHTHRGNPRPFAQASQRHLTSASDGRRRHHHHRFAGHDNYASEASGGAVTGREFGYDDQRGAHGYAREERGQFADHGEAPYEYRSPSHHDRENYSTWRERHPYAGGYEQRERHFSDREAQDEGAYERAPAGPPVHSAMSVNSASARDPQHGYNADCPDRGEDN